MILFKNVVTWSKKHDSVIFNKGRIVIGCQGTCNLSIVIIEVTIKLFI